MYNVSWGLILNRKTTWMGSEWSDQPVSLPADGDRSDHIRVFVSFKDQASADVVRAKLKDLSQKINTTI